MIYKIMEDKSILVLSDTERKRIKSIIKNKYN